MDRQAPIQVCQSQIGAQPVSLQSPSRRLHRKTVTIADVTACGYLSPFQRPQVAASWNEKVSYSARAATALGDMTSPILAATEEHPGTGSQSFAVYRQGILRALLLAATKLRTAPAGYQDGNADAMSRPGQRSCPSGRRGAGDITANTMASRDARKVR